MAQRNELLKWQDVDLLIDHLLGQFNEQYDLILMITRGGIVPGGLLADATNQQLVMIASVDFPTELDAMHQNRLFAWPQFLQFPPDEQLKARHVLIVDDVWGSGRTITAVKNRVAAAGGTPYTCVMHFNPYRSLFGNNRPDYYAAITDAYIIYPWEVDRGGHHILI